MLTTRLLNITVGLTLLALVSAGCGTLSARRSARGVGRRLGRGDRGTPRKGSSLVPV